MCGIFGVVRLDGAPVQEAQLQRGAEALGHRGPDRQDWWIDEAGTVGLAHTRLSIIDTSALGRQPVCDESGRIRVVANGEIYGYQRIRQSLLDAGHRLRSQNDCECLPHLYEEHGDGFVAQLDGMFAFGLWDGESLLLARDPYGQKPLYYCHSPGHYFAFASELAALREWMPSREIDPEQALHYFQHGYPQSPHTPFAAARSVPRGAVMRFQPATESIEVHEFGRGFDSAGSREVQVPADEAEWIASFRDRFRQAVAKRLIADVPLGAFLSGGIDSAAVVAMMHDLDASADRRTFSIHFGEASFDTYDHVEELVRRFSLRHTRIDFGPRDFVQLFEPVMARNADLLADLSLLPMYKLSEVASQDVKVVLTGDGADELLAGYPTYKATAWARRLGLLRLPLGMVSRALASRIPTRRSRTKLNPTVLLRQLGCALPHRHLYRVHALWRAFFRRDELRRLLRPVWDDLTVDTPDLGAAEQREVWTAASGDWLHRAQSLDLAAFLGSNILPKVDRSTMAYGLEARSPFLDQDLGALLAHQPKALKREHPKWLLRRAVAPLLPEAVVWQKKEGFNTPMARWFLEHPEVRELGEHWLFSQQARAHGFFDSHFVQQLWRRHRYQDCHHQLWNLMVFNAWWHHHVAE